MKKIGLLALGLVWVGIFVLPQQKPLEESRPLPAIAVAQTILEPPPSLPTIQPPPTIAPASPAPVLRYITGNRVPLRETADGKSKILDRLNSGLEVIVLEGSGGWQRIRHSLTQQEGWIQKTRLSDRRPEERPKTNSPKGLTESAIIALLIERSVTSYRETRPCACPYNTDRSGRSCGSRSAWSRPGGAKPLCYPGDVTKEMVAGFRQ